MLRRGMRMPLIIEPWSIVLFAKRLIGLVNSWSRLPATPLSLKLRFFHASARTPAVSEPPDTLETRANLFRNPS
jgi:hypothetical protein